MLCRSGRPPRPRSPPAGRPRPSRPHPGRVWPGPRSRRRTVPRRRDGPRRPRRRAGRYSPGSLPHARLLDPRFGPRLFVLVGKVDVVDVDVDLGDLQAGHAFDRLADVAAHGRGQVLDGGAVLDDEVDVDGCLPLADLHGDTSGDRSGVATTGDDIAHGTDRTCGSAAHGVNPADLTGSHPGDLGDHPVGDVGLAALFTTASACALTGGGHLAFALD